MAIRILTEDKITKIFCITDSFLRFFRDYTENRHRSTTLDASAYVSATFRQPTNFQDDTVESKKACLLT